MTVKEAKSIFLFFSLRLPLLALLLRLWGDNEGIGFVNIISGISQLPSSYLWPEF